MVDKTAHSSFLTIKKKYSYMRENEEKNLLCRLAEIVAPQALEFCWGLYYQPKEPDKMREFVAASKRNDI